MTWFRLRILEPLLRLLREGLTPEGLACSLTVGLALGIIPLFGTSTALCVAAALAFRLNQPAMQVANYLAYPLQIALLIPFIRLGEHLFGAPRLPLALPLLLEAVKADAWAALGTFWTSLWHAAVAWALVVPLPAVLLAWVLTKVFRRVAGPRRRP
jgi:uncharacterized protein (DUF2062 family)